VISLGCSRWPSQSDVEVRGSGLVGVIGRFQPFHWGHFEYLAEAARIGTALVVGIANPTERETRVTDSDFGRSRREANPFSYGQRSQMISVSLERLAPQLAFTVRPCDLRSSALLRNSLGSCDLVALTVYDGGGAEKRDLVREAGYDVVILWYRSEKLTTGSEIRRRWRSGEPWEHLVPSGTADVLRQAEKHA